MLTTSLFQMETATSKKYKKMPLDVSFYLRYLSQDKKETLPELMKRYPQYSRTTIYRHSKILNGNMDVDSRHKNTGRRPKLTQRDGRKLVNSLLKLRKSVGNCASSEIQREAGIDERHVSNRTVRRCLKKQGYKYTQCRRKGQLFTDDLKKRVQFARKCNKLPETFWQGGVAFYLDGTGWVHKTDPCKQVRTYRTRMWKKSGESLARECTAKDKKEGSAGKIGKFMAAIAYGKGVIKCHQYEGHVNAQMFADFIEEHFPEMFENSANPKGKLFLQDGDPSQNSALAREAMDLVGCRVFSIPPRSPDLNPIENIFRLIGKQLKREALERNICHETFAHFSERVEKTALNFSPEIIDKTIDSMPRRINAVIKNKGLRTKY